MEDTTQLISAEIKAVNLDDPAATEIPNETKVCCNKTGISYPKNLGESCCNKKDNCPCFGSTGAGCCSNNQLTGAENKRCIWNSNRNISRWSGDNAGCYVNRNAGNGWNCRNKQNNCRYFGNNNDGCCSNCAFSAQENECSFCTIAWKGCCNKNVNSTRGCSCCNRAQKACCNSNVNLAPGCSCCKGGQKSCCCNNVNSAPGCCCCIGVQRSCCRNNVNSYCKGATPGDCCNNNVNLAPGCCCCQGAQKAGCNYNINLAPGCSCCKGGQKSCCCNNVNSAPGCSCCIGGQRSCCRNNVNSCCKGATPGDCCNNKSNFAAGSACSNSFALAGRGRCNCCKNGQNGVEANGEDCNCSNNECKCCKNQKPDDKNVKKTQVETAEDSEEEIPSDVEDLVEDEG